MGEKLLTQLKDATGLPKKAISDELDRLVQEAGLNKSDVTLDDLRSILADYVQEVLLAAKDELREKTKQQRSAQPAQSLEQSKP